ncbi:hypothetical protein ACFQNE_05765 [Gordonia phosphorivorans]|uniref:Uncharacterized protein n=1 Tax=Gordonia phosphorivorans TaxID=1056982 RepID=A0ABV6H525_9ACTN
MSTYQDYLSGLNALATLDDVAERQRGEIRAASQAAIAAADEAGRRADGELEVLDQQRNRVQREVAGLCRSVGVPMIDDPVPRFGTLQEIRRALEEIGRQVERTQKDWQWAERHRQQHVVPPVAAEPVYTPPPPQRPTAPTPPTGGVNPRLVVAAAALLLLLLVVLVLVVL